MMIPFFAELCAGTAALSLRLQGGRNARPPVSRMGNKQGYGEAIFRILGLRSGSGAARYLWCEPDPGCRLLLLSFTDEELRSKAAEIIRGWKDEDPRALWERLRAEGPVKAPEPREAARWLAVGQLSYRQMQPESGFNPGMANDAASPCWRLDLPGVADVLSTFPTLPATVTDDARPLQPARLPPGSVAYIDPPDVGTTGYGHDLTREEVCTLAERWASAGALVVISEAEPLAELSGWHQVEITGERKGGWGSQKRTFSKQQREYLTMSSPPKWRPSQQHTLFSMAAK